MSSSSNRGRDHGRKRPRVGQESRDGVRKQGLSAGNSHPRSEVETTSTPPLTGVIDPTAISFEARIGLALKGSDWQELQNNTPAVATPEADELSEGSEEMDVDVAEGEAQLPKEITAKQRKKMEKFAQTIARDAGEVLQVIEAEALVPVPQEVAWNRDPELLCCYNWQASTDGTNAIFVPGGPAKWHPPTLPHTLPRDSGFSYNDYNYARQPRDPYSPMFHALGVMKPGYQFGDVDVLADRNNLRVLLEFAQGKANGPFRLDLYLVFNTLIIVRKESRWWKHSDGVGYGGNFEKFFTKPAEGMEDATSHYRAIRYPMGPLNVVCRFEADAWDDGIVSDEPTQPKAAVASGGLTERPRFDYRAPIRVLQKGHIVPTAQMVEMKTQRHDPERFRPVVCQDQLWFGRTKLLFTGPYELNTGVINRVKFEDATERVKNWEENNQESLRKLVTLLTQLRDVLKRERRPNRAVVLTREDRAGPLSVRSMTGVQHAVGRQFFEKHWRQAPMQHQQHFGGNRSQRGGGRGTSYAPRGRGQSNAHGQPYASGQPYAPGQSYSARGPSHAPRGRGSTERRTSPDYGRGGSGGRGRGQDRGRGRGQGRGQYGPAS